MALALALALTVAVRAAADGWMGDTARWMACLDDRATLGELTVPCSHDSGMIEGHESYVIPDGLPGIDIRGLLLNQDLSIVGQLRAGARWIELRPEMHDGELYCFHRTSTDLTERIFGGGVGGCGVRFRRVFAETAAFLAANPSETVIFEFATSKMKERGGDVVKLMGEFDGLFYRWPAGQAFPSVNMLPLGAVRGKVVAVLRWVDPDPVNGVWGEIQDGEARPGYMAVTGSSADCVSFDEMYRTQLAQWEALKDLDPAKSAMWMPFVLTWEFDLLDLGNTNRKLADLTNPHLGEFIQEGLSRFGRNPGFVNLDYLTPDLCRQLIACNFGGLVDDWTAHALNPSGDGAFVAPKKTTEYLGTLVDPSARAAAGTVSVKVTKPDRRGEVTVTATVKFAADGQMFSYRAKGVSVPKGEPLEVTLLASNRKSAAHEVRVVLGADSLSGTVDGSLEVDGRRNVFATRDDPARDVIAPFAGTWNGWLSDDRGLDAVPFSAKVGSNGSVTVKGWVGGLAYSCSAKAEVGEDLVAVPVVWRKTVRGEQMSLVFRLVFDPVRGTVTVRDLSALRGYVKSTGRVRTVGTFGFVEAGRPGLEKAAFKALPAALMSEDGPVEVLNTLTCAAKTGLVSGSLKLAAEPKVKAKKAYGVVIGGVGVGRAELDGEPALFRVGD